MDDRQVLHDVHDALAQALMRHERSMLGHWVVIAETTDEDGQRGVWTLAAVDNLQYETLGLLHVGLTSEMGGDE